MSLTSQATQQKFPFPYEAVFDSTLQAITNCGMKVKSTDKVIGRITASVGMSLFSYGENITVIIESINDTTTSVGMESALKIGFNLAGAGKHQKNFDKVIAETSRLLQSSNG